MPRAALTPVAGLLFLSGMCGLVFQVSWFREFRLLFGASTAASSAVLAVFMGGLGIGNALWGKRADRARSPLAFYARLELSIALAAALSPLLIDLLHGLYISLGGQLALGVSLATVVRLAISALVLGAATFLMGGTLPAAVRAVTVCEDQQRRGAALLYGANTLGAVVGALGSTFFALEFFGTRGTLWLACLVNTCTALSALALARYGLRHRRRAPARQGRSKAARRQSRIDRDHAAAVHGHSTRVAGTLRVPSAQGGGGSGRHAERACCGDAPPAQLVYMVAAVAGFAFFLMELVWYRMLGPILGGTTFTFGLILAVALTGIGLGGVAYALLLRRAAISLQGLALTCVLEACAIAAPFALGDRLAILAAGLREANASFSAEVQGWLLIASIVVLPAALISGLQFPLLIGLLGRGDKEVGKQLGLAFGWNTVGAICGSLAGGFGLLPLLSAPGVWRLVAALLVMLGAFVFAYAYVRQGARRGAWAIATAGAGIAAFGMIACPGPTAVWRHGNVGAGWIAQTRSLTDPNALHEWENAIRRSVLWQADGVESSVAVVASSDAGCEALAFHVNGMCDGNALSDAGTQIMLGLIGGALHPQPRSALVVGLGTGETPGWLAEVPSIQRVDVVELEPAVQEMARRCRRVNHDVLASPKVRLIFNDAREVLLTTAAHYDLIACEPSNPYRSGIANLFTREFYLAGRNRLNRGGMFAQWVQAYGVDRRTMRIVLATFKSVFPHVEVWQTQVGDLVLLGCDQTPVYSVSALRSKLATEPFASALACAWHTADLEGLLSHYVGGAALVDHFVAAATAAINTDDHNAIEYGFARALGHKGWDAPAVLYRQSIAIGDQKPTVRGGEVDWNAVVQGRRWDAAVRGGKTLLADDPAIDEGVSDRVLERYLAKDSRGMLFAWQALPHPAPCLTELAVIAQLYAVLGSDRAEPLIQRIADRLPGEAEALRGILAWRQHNVTEAGRRLEAAMLRLRSDPWMLELIREKTFDAAIDVARTDPAQAPKLLQAFGQPLAVSYADENRRLTASVIAGAVGPAPVAQLVESFEPDVPWTESFLTFRRQAYQDAAHRLAARADRDLQEFARAAAEAPASSGSQENRAL
jgi:predicted membrane-bound spermidine synthase